MAKRKTAEMENSMAKRKMVAEMENEKAEQKEVVVLGETVTRMISEMRRIPDGAKVKDDFLWELLRNAKNAILRARGESLVDEKIHFPDSEIFIHIVPDKKNGTLTIMDSGCGMTKRVLDFCIGGYLLNESPHLTTIWEYATTRSDVDLSPLYLDDRRFCLGFHSAYMVADRVKVTTKATGDHDQYVWDSDGFDSYTIARDSTSGERLGRGTKVTLFLNENHLKYADERILQDLVKKYVGRLIYPVHILVDDDGEGRKTMKEIVDDVKQKKERLPIERLRIKFEGLRKKFEKFIGDRVDKVVVSDRLFDIPKYLTIDRRTFVINPRSNRMEKLRQKADKKDCDEDEMEYLVEEHFRDCIINIQVYDSRHRTSFQKMLSPTQRVGRNPFSLAYIKKIEEKKRKKKEMKKKGQRNSLLGTKEKTNSGTSTVKSM